MADEGTGFEPITSQEQLDGIIKGRLAREKLSSKYADYDELKDHRRQYEWASHRRGRDRRGTQKMADYAGNGFDQAYLIRRDETIVRINK